MAKKALPNDPSPGVQVLRTALFKFHEHYEGVWARIRLSLPLGRVLSLQGIEEENIAAQFQRWGDIALVEWNLQDEHGELIPANGEGMLLAPYDLAMLLMKAWQDNLGTVSPPFWLQSENGKLSQVVSIEKDE